MSSSKRHRPEVPRSNNELMELYEDEVLTLKASAARFDKGQTREFRFLASSLRKLAHDTGRSVSLLNQMRLKDRWFLSSARSLDRGNLLCQCDLIELAIPSTKSQRATWQSGLDNWAMEFIDFQSWWTRPILESQSNLFSRSDLILHVADKEGVHVDPNIDEAFAKMRKDGFGWTDGRHVTEHQDRYVIRSIAHEMLKSLDPKYKRRPAVCKDTTFARHIYFGEADAQLAPIISSYHLTPPLEKCPCLSGNMFIDCHGIGAQAPADIAEKGNVVKAPPNAAYAKVVFETKNS